MAKGLPIPMQCNDTPIDPSFRRRGKGVILLRLETDACDPLGGIIDGFGMQVNKLLCHSAVGNDVIQLGMDKILLSSLHRSELKDVLRLVVD